MRLSDEIGPQLGLDQEARGRAKICKKAIDGERNVVGQPCLDDAVAEQLASRRTSGRGHMGEQDRRFGIARFHALHQRQRGPRLADGNGMHPEHRRRKRA